MYFIGIPPPMLMSLSWCPVIRRTSRDFVAGEEEDSPEPLTSTLAGVTDRFGQPLVDAAEVLVENLRQGVIDLFSCLFEVRVEVVHRS